jgi:hypothetical protein
MILFEGGQPRAAALGAQPKGMLEKSLGLTETGSNNSDASGT